ncbi:MAG: hypothetical protein AB7O26_19315, partial [Planctomycetaceae bacterium]
AAPRVLVGFALLLQIAWGQGSLLEWHFPTGSYAMGIGKHLLIIPPTDFARMTGKPDDKPTLHGGREHATTSFGLAENFGRQSILAAKWRNPFASFRETLRALRNGFAVALPVLICMAGLLIFWRPRWWGRGMSAAFCVLMPASFLFGAAEGVDPSAYLKFEDRIEIREGESLAVKIPLSPEFRERLREAAASNPTAQIHVHYRSMSSKAPQPAELRVFNQSTTETRLTISTSDLVAALDANNGVFDATVTPVADSGGIQFRSWQKARAGEGRVADIVATDGARRAAEWFPSIEIRVLRGEQNYPFKPLVRRWDPAIPVGYALVGF